MNLQIMVIQGADCLMKMFIVGKTRQCHVCIDNQLIWGKASSLVYLCIRRFVQATACETQVTEGLRTLAPCYYPKGRRGCDQTSAMQMKNVLTPEEVMSFH